MLLQEGTDIFSDLRGVIQKRFIQNITEKYVDIEMELLQAEIINKSRPT